ncbi:MAG: hypothetical protein V1912_11335 [bacterium]
MSIDLLLAADLMREFEAKREAARAKYAPIVARLTDEEFMGLVSAVATDGRRRFPDPPEPSDRVPASKPRIGLGNR